VDAVKSEPVSIANSGEQGNLQGILRYLRHRNAKGR
jgi:hypothetical protein